MPCSTCYSADIQECPNYLAIDAGLSGNTQYRWQIKDKFGTVYRGLTTTDEPGIMYIPAMESEVFPPGLFMHFSGAFTLTAFEHTTGSTYVPAMFTIDETPYDCISLNVVKYVGEVDDDSPVTTPISGLAPVHVKGDVVIGGNSYAHYTGVILAFRDGIQFTVRTDGSAVDKEINYDESTGLFTYPTDLMLPQPNEPTDIYFIA